MLAIVIFVLLLFIVLGIHIIYPLLLKRISQKVMNLSQSIGKKPLSQFDLPMVSILIPVYNEESVIERRVNNIFESAYPKDKLEIIVIDSGSNDKTRSIIELNFHSTVTLITEEERKGKAHAINLALQICKGEIVILTDGTALYNKGTISQLVNSFSDDTIGAVSAFYDVPNREESQVSASEHKYWLHKDNIRILESKAYSTSWLSGEACAFRNRIISKVNEDSLADDSNIALQIISKGYRVIVNQNARFTERAPTELTDYVKIKSRRTLGGLIETLRFKKLLFKYEYSYFGTVIFPYRFFVYLVSPILSIILIALIIPVTIEIISNLGIYATLLIAAALISVALVLRYTLMPYFYTQLITIIALIWLLTGNVDVRWTRSKTRE
jgi:cellulose synthase/poly-beta-1,6-N-acetylglucosamine synthase-like glycosyltransferase